MIEVTLRLPERSLREIDGWVRVGKYPDRSRAIQTAVDELSRRDRRLRLAREAAKLDPYEEQALAEEFRT